MHLLTRRGPGPGLRDFWVFVPVTPGLAACALAFGNPDYALVRWCIAWGWTTLLVGMVIAYALRLAQWLRRWKSRS